MNKIEKTNNGKIGKSCPFKANYVCNANCGLFCVGLKSCVFHAINKNIMDIRDKLKDIKEDE